MAKYIIHESVAKMPQSCWDRYVRIAVMEVRSDVESVDQIRLTSGVNRIVRTWEKLHDGGPESASARAYDEALDLVARLAADEQRPTRWHQSRAETLVRHRRERIRQAEQARAGE